MSKITDFRSVQVSQGNLVTILSAQQESSSVQCHGTSLVGIIVPVNWTVADITFQISQDGINFFDWRDYETGNPLVTVASAANAAYRMLPADFAGAEHLKLISSIAQAQDVVLTLMLRPV